MDFLEGFLIGPIWSDTEYETRRHTGFYWLLGWLIAAAFAVLVIFPEQASPWLFLSFSWALTLAIVCFGASPFLCRQYYRLHFTIKIPALILLVMKFGLAVYALLIAVSRSLDVDRTQLPTLMLDRVNETLADTSAFFERFGPGLGMLLGIASGGLLIGLTLIVGVLLLSVAPGLLLYGMQLLQRGIDWCVYRFVYHEKD